jgi:hypothetical protein
MTEADALQKLFNIGVWCLLNGAGNKGGATLAVICWLGVAALVATFLIPIAKLIRSFKPKK